MKSPVLAKAALLQALCRGDGFGLELIDRVCVLTGGHIVLKQGSVYPALDALERDSMIVGVGG
jgi:DNA-binding PadR family transcriptional regulator